MERLIHSSMMRVILIVEIPPYFLTVLPGCTICLMTIRALPQGGTQVSGRDYNVIGLVQEFASGGYPQAHFHWQSVSDAEERTNLMRPAMHNCGNSGQNKWSKWPRPHLGDAFNPEYVDIKPKFWIRHCTNKSPIMRAWVHVKGGPSSIPWNDHRHEGRIREPRLSRRSK